MKSGGIPVHHGNKGVRTLSAVAGSGRSVSSESIYPYIQSQKLCTQSPVDGQVS